MVITGLFFVLACRREQSLTEDGASRLAKSGLARDSTDTTDKIPTHPTDTIPDSVWTTIKGLKITPSGTHNDSVLRLQLETTNTYPADAAWLQISGRLDSSTLFVNVRGMYHGAPSATRIPATGSIAGKITGTGTYPLKIKLKERTFTGSFTATATQYIFNWDHDSVITIHPKTVQRIP